MLTYNDLLKIGENAQSNLLRTAHTGCKSLSQNLIFRRQTMEVFLSVVRILGCVAFGMLISIAIRKLK